MKKITLTKDMKNRHLNYYIDHVVPNFTKYDQLYRFVDKPNRAASVDLFAHFNFMSFCIQNQFSLAVGSIKTLQMLQSVIEQNYKHILQMLACQDKKYKLSGSSKEPVTYKAFLLSIFGYHQFNTDLYAYVKKEAGCSDLKYSKVTYLKMLDTLEVLYPHDKLTIMAARSEEMKSADFKIWLMKLFENNLLDITLKNYSGIFPFNRHWNPYTLIFMTGLRVCPYCNRQYITPVYTKGGKIRADLDHFLPKSEYPYFSMSLQNLVPSCKFCNSSVKGADEYGFELLNPYSDPIDEHIKFYINPGAVDKLDVKVSGPPSYKKKSENYLDLFKIKTQYSYHKNVVNELLLKRRIYTNEYIDDLYQNYRQYFSNEEELKELIYGCTDQQNQPLDEPLAKLRKDILEQIHPIHSTPLLDQLIRLVNK